MQDDCLDRQIAALAESQHGVVTRRQLLEFGTAPQAIRHRLERGRLHPVHRGVYAVGHRVLTVDGIRIAATLAAGAGAVLSHRAAAALWELRASDALEVTLERSHRPLRGLRIHHLPLAADEVTTVRAIPVTTVPRTLFDLAAVLPRHQVERAINEAEVRPLTDPLSLADLVSRYPRRAGIATIKAILARLSAGTARTRSELEARFLDFLRRARLPRPEVNASLFVAGRSIECDFLWRERRVIAELDGWKAHGTAAAFERDRARDRMLSARGWRLVRITWRQLHDDADAVASDLRKILARQPSSKSASAA
jgi:very-short-patch-repair endonuclease